MSKAFEGSRIVAWSVAIAAWLAGCAWHRDVSLALVRPRGLPWEGGALSGAIGFVGVPATLLLLFVVARQVRRAPEPRALALAWLLLVAAVVAVDGHLTYSLAEIAHYPQYALVAWLVARAIDPGRTLNVVVPAVLWTTLLGAGDELAQYLWTNVPHGDYVDFNDILVNLLGATGGALLWQGSRPAPVAASARGAVAAWGFVVAIALAGLASGRLVVAPPVGVAAAPGGWLPEPGGRTTLALQRRDGLYGARLAGPRRGDYLVLSPLPALAIGAVAFAILAALASKGLRPRAACPGGEGSDRSSAQ